MFDLKELEREAREDLEIAKEATKRPFKAVCGTGVLMSSLQTEACQIIAAAIPNESDGKFIAHACNTHEARARTILELIERVKKLENILLSQVGFGKLDLKVRGG